MVCTSSGTSHPDVIVFPGGAGTRPPQSDARVLDWVRDAHASTDFTTSVCTGSLVLGAAGLLDGLTATTYWANYADLAACRATPVPERVVEHLDRRIITAAGVSAGIEMALRLTELLADRTAAQAAQLMIEYDPQPPFDCGARPRPGRGGGPRPGIGPAAPMKGRRNGARGVPPVTPATMM